MNDFGIVLLASERSGSNLLRSLLGNHSQISAPVAPHLLVEFYNSSKYYGDLRDLQNIKELLRCPNLSAKKQYDYNLPRCIEVSCDCKGGKCLGLYHKKYKEDTF